MNLQNIPISLTLLEILHIKCTKFCLLQNLTSPKKRLKFFIIIIYGLKITLRLSLKVIFNINFHFMVDWNYSQSLKHVLVLYVNYT